MERKFKVEIIITNNCETMAQGLQNAKQTIKGLGLSVQDCKPIKSTRTDRQNASLHLWLTQLSEEMKGLGLDMRAILKDGFEFSPTPYALKEFVFRPTMKAMFGKSSTTKLDKTEEINAIVDVITRALHERTNGILIVPSFPSIERMIEEDNQ